MKKVFRRYRNYKIKKIDKLLKKNQVANKLGLKCDELNSCKLFAYVKFNRLKYSEIMIINESSFSDLEKQMKLLYNHEESNGCLFQNKFLS